MTFNCSHYTVLSVDNHSGFPYTCGWSQAIEPNSLTWYVVGGDFHLQSIAAVAEILSREDGTLLADEQRRL